MDKVRAMLAPLGRDEKARLYDRVSLGGLWDEQMERQVARLLVEQLNGARTEHARRLWTSWFDPILLRDDLTLLAEERLPGSLHIAEAGAWWFALAGFLEPLPGTVQAAIAERSRDQPLEKIFASPEAGIWADELRRQTLTVIASLRAKVTSCNRLIADANAHRARLIKDRGLACPTVLTPADLDSLEAMLMAAPAWKELGKPAAQAEPGDLARFAATAARRDACSPEGAVLLTLGFLHARRDPAFALMLHRSLWQPVLRAAVIAHFQFAAQWLRHGVGVRYLAKTSPLQPFLGTLNATTLLAQLFAWYDTVHTLEADRDERARAVVTGLLGSMIGLIEQELVPAVSRHILSLNPRSSPLSAIEQVEFVGLFQAALKQRGFASSGNSWLPALGAHVAEQFRAIAVAGAQQPEPGQSLPTLARFARLGELINAPIEISAINKALITVVGGALREPGNFDPLELQLIERVVAKSQEERRRSKWWVSPEVSDLLEIVERSGPAGTVKAGPAD